MQTVFVQLKLTIIAADEDEDTSEEYNKIIFRTIFDICNLGNLEKISRIFSNVFQSMDSKQLNRLTCPLDKVRNLEKKCFQELTFILYLYRAISCWQMSP